MAHTKTAVFGSAFNPPHMGHADVINQALEKFDRVVVVPSYAHAFGKAMAPFALRLDLTRTLVALHEAWQSRVIVSDVEHTIATQKKNNEPIYSFDVLSELETLYPEEHLVFVVGPDNAAPQTWAKFYKAKAIEQRWGRWEALERKPVRSTAIRNLLQTGEQPSEHLCPAAVWQPFYAHMIQTKNDEN